MPWSALLSTWCDRREHWLFSAPTATMTLFLIAAGSLYAHDFRACSEEVNLMQTRASGAAEATAAQGLQERRLVLVSVSLFSIGQVTKVSGWTVLGRFYSHLAFCNYFWPVRYRVGIVGIRNLGYRRRDRELDTCPSWYHQKMLGIIPIRRYWYLGCDTESIPSRFLRNVRIVKKWAIPC